MPPRGAGDEQHRQRAGDVDQRRAEIRLGHHDHRRQQRDEHDAGRRVAVHRAHVLDQERRHDEHEEDLAQLRRLEVEERQRDPRVRSARGLRQQQDHDQQADQDPEQRVAQLPQARVVQPRHAVHEKEPRRRVGGLAVEVVVRLALDVVHRRALEHDQRARHEAERGQQQRHVQTQPPLARGERGRRLGGRLDGRQRRAHRVCEVPTLNWRSPTSNHFDRINRAVGAALSAPKPPFSIVTTTTIGRVGCGT